jgi:hypothetical protein
VLSGGVGESRLSADDNSCHTNAAARRANDVSMGPCPPDLSARVLLLAGALDVRQWQHCAALLCGALFATGRRTVTSWLRAVPPPRRRGQRGRPRPYGPGRISLAKRAGPPRGWREEFRPYPEARRRLIPSPKENRRVQ